MSQINLMSGGEGTGLPKLPFFSGSVFFSFVVLIVSFGVYFGVLFYQGALRDEIASLVADNDAERNLIAGEKADRVADFSDRLSVIGGNLEETVSTPNDPLSRIERSLTSGINLTSYMYDIASRTVKIGVTADSFRAIAENIITLKKGEKAFSSVAVEGGTALREDGKIEATFILSL